MLNTPQQELLDSLIAEEGIYFETIRDDEAFNLGTKILYLERAISQDCQTFNQSLDKLYNPDLDGEPKAANIEFIRALKLINDLCFNSDVKYDPYGTRAALTHYFGSLGNIDAIEFQTAVQEIINARITAVSEGQEETTITAQKQARQTAEKDIASEVGWRTKFDLPLAQLAQSAQLAQLAPHVYFALVEIMSIASHVIIALLGILILTGEQYQQLSVELRQVIAGNVDATRRLIQDFGVTFEQIKALSAQGLQELFNQSHAVARLVNEGNITFEQLSGLSVVQLRTVIADPNSEASQQILNPPSSSFRPGMF